MIKLTINCKGLKLWGYFSNKYRNERNMAKQFKLVELFFVLSLTAILGACNNPATEGDEGGEDTEAPTEEVVPGEEEGEEEEGEEEEGEEEEGE